MLESSAKIKVFYQFLERKELVTETGEVSLMGKELLDFMDSAIKRRIVKRKPATTEFEKFWESFPSTNGFTYNNRTFTTTRGIRVNKGGTIEEFDKILNEGAYTADQITNAMLKDVKIRQIESVKKGSNQLTFMQNCKTYLANRAFEPFIDIIEVEEMQSSNDSTDI
jgi:hypothetical protein